MKTILLHSITPDELKDIVIVALKAELKALFFNSNEPKSYTVKQASELLQCSKLTIYNYIKKGLLPASKIGRNIIIKKADMNNALIEIKSMKYKR